MSAEGFRSSWAPVLAAMVIGLLAALVVSGSAIVVRFARSAGEERLQLKWIAAAAVLAVATFIALILTNPIRWPRSS